MNKSSYVIYFIPYFSNSKINIIIILLCKVALIFIFNISSTTVFWTLSYNQHLLKILKYYFNCETKNQISTGACNLCAGKCGDVL